MEVNKRGHGLPEKEIHTIPLSQKAYFLPRQEPTGTINRKRGASLIQPLTQNGRMDVGMDMDIIAITSFFFISTAVTMGSVKLGSGALREW